MKYNDVINFNRCNSPKGVSHHCVMCGSTENVIPQQNKDVCRSCDTSFWLHKSMNVVVKFCKGCKNFVALGQFHDKPEASKCARCRHRGRQNYFSKKVDRSPSPNGHNGNSDSDSEMSSFESGGYKNKLSRSERAALKAKIENSTPANTEQKAVAVHASYSALTSSVSGRPPTVPRRTSPSNRMKDTVTKKSASKQATPQNSNGIADRNLSTPMSLGTKGWTVPELPGHENGYNSDGGYDFSRLTYSGHTKTRANSIASILTTVNVPSLSEQEYDPNANPLMHLALLTEKVFGSGGSPFKLVRTNNGTIAGVLSPVNDQNGITSPLKLLLNQRVGSPFSALGAMGTAAVDSTTKMSSIVKNDENCNPLVSPSRTGLKRSLSDPTLHSPLQVFVLPPTVHSTTLPPCALYRTIPTNSECADKENCESNEVQSIVSGSTDTETVDNSTSDIARKIPSLSLSVTGFDSVGNVHACSDVSPITEDEGVVSSLKDDAMIDELHSKKPRLSL